MKYMSLHLLQIFDLIHAAGLYLFVILFTGNVKHSCLTFWLPKVRQSVLKCERVFTCAQEVRAI